MEKRSTLLKFFPVPVFLKRPSAGLDISYGVIRFIEFEMDKTYKVIKKFGIKNIPEDIISPDKELKKSDDLVEILKKIKNDFNLHFVNVAFPEKIAYLFTTKIPKVKGIVGQEIMSNLEFQLEENVPIPSKTAVFGYEFIKDKNKESQDEVVVSVLPKDDVSKFVNVLEGAEIVPLSLETEAHSIARAVVPKDDEGSYMVVDFGRTRTCLIVVENGVVLFSTTIDFGGNDLTRVIEKGLSMSFSEAEDFKNQKGLNKEKMGEDLFSNLLAVISAIRDEINKYYNYWLNKKDEDEDKERIHSIKKIILCGESAGLDGFCEHLSLDVKVPVKLADVWVNVFPVSEYLPPINFSDSLGFATAIGLALRDRV